MYPKIGVLKALKRGRKSLDRPLFAAEEARSRGLGLFSKQFRKGNSRKVEYEILHKTGPMRALRHIPDVGMHTRQPYMLW
jgi:hypothetical protein